MTELPYQIIGENRPGRWLVTCDHASNRVPDWVAGGDLGIAPEDMARHIAYDIGAAGLAAALAMGDLGVIALFATEGAETLPLQVWRVMGAYRTQTAEAAALLLVGLSLGLFLIFDLWGRRHADT